MATLKLIYSPNERVENIVELNDDHDQYKELTFSSSIDGEKDTTYFEVRGPNKKFSINGRTFSNLELQVLKDFLND